MRAVNLVPAEDRRGARGAGTRSGGGVYAVLGVLALLVAILAVSTVQKRENAGKRGEVRALQVKTAAAEARTRQLATFTEFAALRARRVETVSSLAASRFDWSHALREFSRVVPAGVWLTGLQGTVNPGVTLKESAVSGTGTIRSAGLTPAVEVEGCTTDQRAVAGMLTRMRLIDGVSRVALLKSEKAKAAQGAVAGADPAADAGADCRQGDERLPQFQFVVFFDAAAGAVPTQGPDSAGRVPTSSSPATGPTAPATTGATP